MARQRQRPKNDWARLDWEWFDVAFEPDSDAVVLARERDGHPITDQDLKVWIIRYVNREVDGLEHIGMLAVTLKELTHDPFQQRFFWDAVPMDPAAPPIAVKGHLILERDRARGFITWGIRSAVFVQG
jgi:hypothetical protein